MPYRHKLDPKVDLVGATPETLAAALFRNHDPALRPAKIRQPVTGGEVTEQEVTTDHPGDGIPHLVKRI